MNDTAGVRLPFEGWRFLPAAESSSSSSGVYPQCGPSYPQRVSGCARPGQHDSLSTEKNDDLQRCGPEPINAGHPPPVAGGDLWKRLWIDESAARLPPVHGHEETDDGDAEADREILPGLERHHERDLLAGDVVEDEPGEA